MVLTRKHLSVALVLVTLLSQTAACGDRARGYERIGVTTDASGIPMVVLYPCPGQSITTIELWSVTSDGKDDHKIWSIDGSPGTGLPVRVVAGQVPQSAIETQ